MVDSPSFVDARENIAPGEGDINANEVLLDNAGEDLAAPRPPRGLFEPDSAEQNANSFQTPVPQSPSYLRCPGATSTSLCVDDVEEDMNEHRLQALGRTALVLLLHANLPS